MSMKGNVRPDPSKGGRTRQSEKDACDVNLIVAHHRRGGVSAHVMKKVGEYGYVPSTDFHENMLALRRAQELFEELPAVTRDFFQNDPGRFVNFVSTDANKAKLLELGLVMPKAKPEPVLGSSENPIHVAAPAAGAGAPK